MSLWFVRHNPSGQCAVPLRVNVSENPAPTVMAGGIVGDNCSHYWLEDDGMVTKVASPARKPPYRVPSMAEVARLRGTNGLTVVSTFSGCGGSCLGFEMAGYRVLWASEFVEAAREVYRLNHPGVPVDDRDIRLVDPGFILRAIGKRSGDVDVLEGSPPCASFSTAGKRDAGWGTVKKYSDTRQRTDDLFFEFARILRGLQPRAFVAENVSGLVKGTAKGYFKDILRALRDCGYRVEARVLDAQWLGVPQARQRLIFVGARNDLGVEPRHPVPLKYRYSVADACPWIAKSEAGQGSRPAIAPSPAPTIGEERAPSIAGYAIEKEVEKLRAGQDARYLNLSLADEKQPCPTITAQGGTSPGTACVIAPCGTRKFSIPELKRICAFPDDFQLTGTYARRWERLGRAVPPLMMRAVARVVAEMLSESKARHDSK